MNNEPELKIRNELINIYNSNNFNSLIKRINNLREDFPKSVFLLNILGNTNNQIGNFSEAIINFQKILEINQNFADSHYNLGIVYKKINQIEKAINHYKKCLTINPLKFEAYNNLGNIYKDKNEQELAIKNYLHCLEIKPNYLFALQNFGVCLQNFKFSKHSNILEKHIINLLEHDKILRPIDIINSLINYLYLDNEFYSIIKNLKNNKITESLDQLIDKFLEMKILTKLLKIVPITNIQIENALRYLRTNILLNITSIKNKKKASQLMNLIATQCFLNEYLYPKTSKEEEYISKLEEVISNKLTNKNSSELLFEITCMAAYKPLYLYEWATKISGIKEISNLVNQQIFEPQKERDIKKKLESKKIENLISLKVKDQYEDSPYPRWQNIALKQKKDKPIDFFSKLNLRIKNNKIRKWKNINVLVAGCGTGQHALTTATKFQKSFITAIDLSANSLSYAKRKAEELEITNIEFIQMDLLDIEKIGKTFDIIESVGVLHHMENPYSGLEKLSNVLNINGLIMIGLYSKIARKHIERIRLDIKKLKIKINELNIKNFREKIILSKQNDYKLITNSPDFYALSNFRDLLFHIKEYRFTIPEIKKFIDNLNLKFCGFENKELLNLFKMTHQDDSDLYNLKLWDEFELNNPRIFAGMYQFWCQKN